MLSYFIYLYSFVNYKKITLMITNKIITTWQPTFFLSIAELNNMNM